jgi:hypothetical protein
MRKRPVLLAAILVIVALGIQVNYDNQFKNLILGSSGNNPQGQQIAAQLPAGGGANPAAIQQRLALAAGVVSTDSYIRFSSYLIGVAAIMCILIGALVPEKKTEVT